MDLLDIMSAPDTEMADTMADTTLNFKKQKITAQHEQDGDYDNAPGNLPKIGNLGIMLTTIAVH